MFHIISRCASDIGIDIGLLLFVCRRFLSEAPAEIKLIITVLFYKPQAEQNKGFSAFFVDRLDFTAVSLVRMSTHSVLYKKCFLSPEEFSAMNRFRFLSGFILCLLTVVVNVVVVSYL